MENDALNSFGSLCVEMIDCPTHGKQKSVSIAGRPLRCVKCIEDKATEDFKQEVGLLYARREKSRIDRAVKQSGIPARYLESSLSNYEHDLPAQLYVLNKCIEYAANFEQNLRVGKSMIFYGYPGTGKTHLLVAIARELLNKKHTVKYVPFLDMIDAMKSVANFKSTLVKDDVIAAYLLPDLLIIDEAGVAYQNDMEYVFVYEIMNARYNQRKPTILSSNQNLEELTKCFGDRVIDRMRDSDGKAYQFSWESYRK